MAGLRIAALLSGLGCCCSGFSHDLAGVLGFAIAYLSLLGIDHELSAHTAVKNLGDR